MIASEGCRRAGFVRKSLWAYARTGRPGRRVQKPPQRCAVNPDGWADLGLGDAMDHATTADLCRRLRASAEAGATDHALHHEIAIGNLRLARWAARRAGRPGDPDAISEAYLSLLKMVRGFDPDAGVTLDSYAIKGMTADVFRWFLRHEGVAVRPCNPNRLGKSRMGTREELAAIRASLRPARLPEDGGPRSRESDPAEDAERGDEADRLRRFVAGLGGEEALVMGRRLAGMNYSEIARDLGRSHQHIHNVNGRAERAIRAAWEAS